MQCGSAGDGHRDGQFVLRKKQWLIGPEENGGNMILVWRGAKRKRISRSIRKVISSLVFRAFFFVNVNLCFVVLEIRIDLEKIKLLIFIVFFSCFLCFFI
ncbi:uncharacterized protein DS421_3g99670 [Arachis hypogaea]|nr:uncharacterized protein DS421_3g99670 [Arachis hypogaea]